MRKIANFNGKFTLYVICTKLHSQSALMINSRHTCFVINSGFAEGNAYNELSFNCQSNVTDRPTLKVHLACIVNVWT